MEIKRPLLSLKQIPFSFVNYNSIKQEMYFTFILFIVCLTTRLLVGK